MARRNAAARSPGDGTHQAAGGTQEQTGTTTTTNSITESNNTIVLPTDADAHGHADGHGEVPDEDEEDEPSEAEQKRRESKFERAYQALELKFFRDDADSTSSGSPTRGDVDDAEASDSAHAVTERFHDAGGECYMTVPVGDDDHQHHETMRIESKVAKRWIQYQAHLTGMMLQDREIKMIQSAYVATAYYEGPVHEVAQRIYQPDDDTIWLDLCDERHRAIKITPNVGWRIIADPPVRFIRKKGNLPLPVPVTPPLLDGQSAAEFLAARLRPYLNIAPPVPLLDERGKKTGESADHDWTLLICWLVAALRPHGPFVILELCGEKGSAKSTLGRVLRCLIDPHVVPLEPQPGDLRDMAIAAQGSWLLAYDNLSHLSVRQSNALCRMSTGGGFRTRQLYTDDEEAIFSFLRPVLLTGISEVVVRPDLLDRTLMIHLPVIDKAHRRSERRFWREFDQEVPVILGALLTVVAETLRLLPTVEEVELGRMADFSHIAAAIERAMGWKLSAFAQASQHAEEEARSVALEGSSITTILLSFLNLRRGQELIDPYAFDPSTATWDEKEQHVLWRGSMTELLKELKKVGGVVHPTETDWQRKIPDWPKTPQRLTMALTDIMPYLRQMGLDVTPNRSGKLREYRIVDTRTDAQVQENAEQQRQ